MVVLTEPDVLSSVRWSDGRSLAALAVSCVLGVGISYFAFLCRAAVSATCFTVVGNVCKASSALRSPPGLLTTPAHLLMRPLCSQVITVLINVAIWDKHASPLGLGCLGLCLLGAGFYQQAPKRADTVDEYESILAENSDEPADTHSSQPGAGAGVGAVVAA